MPDRLRILLLMQGGVEWIGGTEYIRNLALALADLPEARSGRLEVNLLANQSVGEHLLNSAAQHAHRTYSAKDFIRPRTLKHRIRRKVLRDILRIRQAPVDEFLNEAGFDFAYPHLVSCAKASRVRSAAWIPDFQHKALPEYFSDREIGERDAFFGRIARDAPLVILSSKCAERDFHAYFPEAGEKSRVLAFRTVPENSWYEPGADAVRRKYNLPERFFIVCNQLWKHKNHLLVIDALKRLKSRGICSNVVCTGHLYDYRHPEYTSEVLQAIHKADVADRVFLLGLTPRADQIQLMRCSVGLVQASLFEGWSTVVEDARALGKTILLSDIPVHREQDPPHSHYFEPHSGELLAELMARVWTSARAGPDAGGEDFARREQQRHSTAFARTFVNIVEEAQTVPLGSQ